MVSGTSRRFAVPIVVACMGVLGSAATAHAAGGLSVTPAVLEHRATLGNVGSLTLNNTTKESLKVTVRVRPWLQQLNGNVFTDPRSTFSRYVRATRQSFTIAAGAKVPVNFRMRRRTSSGSLYGNVDILGKPVKTKGRKGIIPQYRLISSLRLHPARQSLRLRTGAGADPRRRIRAAGAEPREHDRAGQRHLQAERSGHALGLDRRDARDPGQARRRWASARRAG